MTLKIVIAGDVDHGKSTLIGRLLHDTGSLMDGKAEELQRICKKRCTEKLEWSFLLDSFQAERNQAITIDSTQVRFATALRPYVMIDAPGHKEFISNMMSGAAQADAAILVIDAVEGIQEQTRNHAQLLRLIGIQQLVVVVNKMDSASYKQSVFEKLVSEIESLSPSFIVPLCAQTGEMIVSRGNNMNWYSGKTLVEILDSFSVTAPSLEKPLRFSVQDVYRVEGKRIIVGRVESGIMRKGDELLFSPMGQQARVETLEVWPANSSKSEALPGESVGITLDSHVFIERGHVASHNDSPPMLSHVVRVTIAPFTMHRFTAGNFYRARFGTIEAPFSIQSVDNISGAAVTMTLRSPNLLPVDSTGKIVLSAAGMIAGAGVMSMEGLPDQRHLL